MNLLLSFLPGCICFFLLTKGSVLDTGNVSWLLDGGDPVMFWVGWQYFRQSPLLQFPLGLNPMYGLDISSSVVYSDSIPLLCILFKPFHSILPDTFQFFGIWVFICFLLQSYFANKLLELFIPSRKVRFLFSFFFCLAPCFLWRLNGHYSLFAHWVILAGLYFYFSKKFRFVSWILLLAVSIFIHPYIAFFSFSLFAADLVQRFWKHQIKTFEMFYHLFASLAVSIFAAWSAGYFVLNDGFSADASGYRMNLLSLVDSEADWSRWIPDIPGMPLEYEGFNYLGIGVILLFLITILSFPKKKRSRRSQFWPIFILMFLLTVYSLSEQVSFSNHILFSYDYPLVFESFRSIFRANGRMFWPVFYVLYLIVMIYFYRSVNKKWSEAIILISLLLYVFDLYPKLEYFQNRFNHPTSIQKQFSSNDWKLISKPYRNLLLVYPSNKSLHWDSLAFVALENRMAINFGYFTRVSKTSLLKARNKLDEEIQSGKFNSESLYVFREEWLWKKALQNKHESDSFGMIDGMYYLAPGFNKHGI